MTPAHSTLPPSQCSLAHAVVVMSLSRHCRIDIYIYIASFECWGGLQGSGGSAVQCSAVMERC